MVNVLHTLLIGSSNVRKQSSKGCIKCELHDEGRLLSWDPGHGVIVAQLRDISKQSWTFERFPTHEMRKGLFYSEMLTS